MYYHDSSLNMCDPYGVSSAGQLSYKYFFVWCQTCDNYLFDNKEKEAKMTNFCN